MTQTWITNIPSVAKKLCAADRAYAAARAAAIDLPLAEKVYAYQRAKDARALAYSKVGEAV